MSDPSSSTIWDIIRDAADAIVILLAYIFGHNRGKKSAPTTNQVKP